MFGRGKDEEIIEEEKPVKKTRKKEPEDDREWDVRKILVTGFFLVVAFLVAMQIKDMFFPQIKLLGDATSRKSVQVQKPNIAPPQDLNVQSQVDSTIDQVKKNVSDLNAQDVATSSPQIQKVLHDIQGIKDLPANKAREQCQKICSGI